MDEPSRGSAADGRPVLRLARLLGTATLLAGIFPGAASATGVFGSVEAGYHRIVPTAGLFARVLDGHEGSTLFSLAAGYEVAQGVLLSAQAGHLEFEPQLGYYSPQRFRGEEPSRIRYVPLLVSLGLRVPAASRFGLTMSAGAGVAHQRMESEILPERWNRSTWQPAWRLALGGDYGQGATRVGARVAWLFLPRVRIQQMPKQVGFGGLSVAATLSFGHRLPARP